jgi:hypothetical protein
MSIAFLTAIMLASAPAATIPAGGTTDQADAQCFIIVASLIGKDPSKAQELQGGLTYFTGKIIGRHPDADLEALVRAAAPVVTKLGGSEFTRCGGELQQVGDRLQTLGSALRAHP